MFVVRVLLRQLCNTTTVNTITNSQLCDDFEFLNSAMCATPDFASFDVVTGFLWCTFARSAPIQRDWLSIDAQLLS
jgi:hypothetical protein